MCTFRGWRTDADGCRGLPFPDAAKASSIAGSAFGGGTDAAAEMLAYVLL
jgi:hypothetical protein